MDNKSRLPLILSIICAVLLLLCIYLFFSGRSSLSQKQAELDDTRTKISEHEGLLSSAESELADRDTALSEQKALGETLQSELEAQKSNNESLESELTDQKSQNESLQSELTDQKSQNESLQSELTDQKSQNESLRSELEEQKSRNDSSQSGKDEGNDTAHTEEGTSGKLRISLASVGETILDATSDPEVLVAALEEQKEAVQQKVSEILENKEEISQKESEIAANKEEIAQIESELAVQIEAAAQIESELAEQKTVNAQQESELEQHKEDIAQKESELTAQKEEITQNQSELAELNKMNDQLESDLEVQKEEIIQKESEIAEQKEIIAEQKEKVQSLEEKLDQIANVRKKIIAELTEKFADTDLNIVVDDQTGVISMDSNVLFDLGSYDLTTAGCNLLAAFFRPYCDIVLDDDVKDYISEIIIEGHTDQSGPYLYNLLLSQQRAQSVAEFCIADTSALLSDEQLNEIRSMLTVNGRAYSDPIYNENNEIDANASRRVEVQFRLLSDDLLTDIVY